jgi:hypothetical protein
MPQKLDITLAVAILKGWGWLYNRGRTERARNHSLCQKCEFGGRAGTVPFKFATSNLPTPSSSTPVMHPAFGHDQGMMRSSRHMEDGNPKGLIYWVDRVFEVKGLAVSPGYS